MVARGECKRFPVRFPLRPRSPVAAVWRRDSRHVALFFLVAFDHRFSVSDVVAGASMLGSRYDVPSVRGFCSGVSVGVVAELARRGGLSQ